MCLLTDHTALIMHFGAEKNKGGAKKKKTKAAVGSNHISKQTSHAPWRTLSHALFFVSKEEKRESLGKFARCMLPKSAPCIATRAELQVRVVN